MADAGKTGEQGQQGNGTPPKPGEQDDGIQKAINAVIARERADANARVAALEAKLAALQAPKPEDKPADKAKPGDEAYAESIRKPLVDELAQLKAALAQRESADITATITGIAKPLTVDGAEQDVAAALAGRVKPGKDGKLEVVDKDGRIEYGKSGPKTLEELVMEHLQAKPYLAKASVRSGIEVGGVAKSTAASDTREGLQAQIAQLDAVGKFAESAPLKTKLSHLASRAS